MLSKLNCFKSCVGISALVVLIGCGQSSTTVTGSVTYNGEAVKKGFISFRPSDGHGQSFAAQIVDGQFTTYKANPGMKMVVVSGVKEINFYTSSEESYKKAEEAKKAGDPMAYQIGEAANYIAEDAEGNSKQVEIQPGDQTLDFSITGTPRP